MTWTTENLLTNVVSAAAAAVVSGSCPPVVCVVHDASVMFVVVTTALCPSQVNLGLPCPQRVVQLPDIAWEQYTSGLGDFQREFCDKKRKTRRLKLIFDKGLGVSQLFITSFFCVCERCPQDSLAEYNPFACFRFAGSTEKSR